MNAAEQKSATQVTGADRELLEMAAKAAGYDVRWHEIWQCFVHVGPFNTDSPPTLAGQRMTWVPLTDDGDRYRLAKKLDIRIHFGPCYVTYSANRIAGVVRWPEDEKDDARAIVRAAARIGAAVSSTGGKP